jgi:hypothetical protein
VRAEIAHARHAEPEEAAVAVDGQLGRVRHAAPVKRGGHALAARLHPLDGPAQAARRECRHHFLVGEPELAAEAPAHLRGDHPDDVLGDAEDPGEEGPGPVRGLGRGPEGQGARLPLREAGAGLEGQRREPLVHDADLDHPVSAGERVLDLAARPRVLVGEVARHVLVELDRAGRPRPLRIHDGLERLVVDLDQLGGVARDGTVAGDDEGDGMSDEAYAPGGEGEARRVPRAGRGEDEGLRRRHHADAMRGVPDWNAPFRAGTPGRASSSWKTVPIAWHGS